MPKPKTPTDYQALAKRLGWTWTGQFPKNTNEPTDWVCSRRHTIARSYSVLSSKLRNTLGQEMRCAVCWREDQGTVQRHAPEAYHALAAEHGYVWLGPEVNGALERTAWECGLGHRWSGRYNDIQQGHGCRFCAAQRKAAKARRQPGEYYALAAQRGYTWLGPEVKRNKEKTHWLCAAGHAIFASFNQITTGRSCKECSGLAPKTAQDFLDLAASRGFKCIGRNVVNTGAETMWECAEGHRWSTSYNSIQQGSGCPCCAGVATKVSDDYSRLAGEAGLVWLGPVPANSKGTTRWRCPEGHLVQKSFNAVQACNGCLECSGLAPKSPTDYHELASKRGFEWLGRDAPNTHTSTLWRCSKGHEWEAAYTTIHQGHGCPQCLDLVNGKLVSKAQRRICTMVDGELNAPLGRHRIDVAKTVDDIRIAIEYDSWFFHGKKEENDRAKDEVLLNDGWRVLRIRSNRLVPSKCQLDEAIEQLVDGDTYLDIVLDDWGEGPVAWFHNRD